MLVKFRRRNKEEIELVRNASLPAVQNFILYLYQRGFLKDFEVKDNGKGKLSVSGFSVHHNIPIALGGTNDFENLRLLDNKLHTFIHKYYLDIYVQKNSLIAPEGSNVVIPDLNVISTCRQYEELIIRTMKENSQKLKKDLQSKGTNLAGEVIGKYKLDSLAHLKMKHLLNSLVEQKGITPKMMSVGTLLPISKVNHLLNTGVFENAFMSVRVAKFFHLEMDYFEKLRVKFEIEDVRGNAREVVGLVIPYDEMFVKMPINERINYLERQEIRYFLNEQDDEEYYRRFAA